MTAFLVFAGTPASAENFVRNGGFEEISSCPNLFGQIARADFWVTPITNSDLFHGCAPFSSGNGLQTPANLFGNATCGRCI